MGPHSLKSLGDTSSDSLRRKEKNEKWEKEQEKINGLKKKNRKGGGVGAK